MRTITPTKKIPKESHASGPVTNSYIGYLLKRQILGGYCSSSFPVKKHQNQVTPINDPTINR
jgi:hypothetical protein